MDDSNNCRINNRWTNTSYFFHSSSSLPSPSIPAPALSSSTKPTPFSHSTAIPLPQHAHSPTASNPWQIKHPLNSTSHSASSSPLLTSLSRRMLPTLNSKLQFTSRLKTFSSHKITPSTPINNSSSSHPTPSLLPTPPSSLPASYGCKHLTLPSTKAKFKTSAPLIPIVPVLTSHFPTAPKLGIWTFLSSGLMLTPLNKPSTLQFLAILTLSPKWSTTQSFCTETLQCKSSKANLSALWLVSLLKPLPSRINRWYRLLEMAFHLQLGTDVDTLMRFSINCLDALAVGVATVDLAAIVGLIIAIWWYQGLLMN